MFIDRAGRPFIVAALIVTVVLGLFAGWVCSSPGLVLATFFLFFFRDPSRATPSTAGLVISPADARITVAGDPPGPGGPAGEWRHVSMFLSLFDVHVNRTPVEGQVTHVSHHPGKSLLAHLHEAGEPNEWTEVWFDRGGQRVVCRQIVGILARRIVCRLKVGDQLTRGQSFGVMKFGSRIDLFLPPEAESLVKPGDHVTGGETAAGALSANRP